jgi:Leucine-rich repeat (LRR) protein
MQKNLTIILVILLYSCGGDSPITPPPSIDYYTDDQQFIDELADANGIANTATIKDGITPVEVDSGSISYYMIEKLNLADMGLTLIPSSIGMLERLDKLDISNNQLTSIPHQICDIAIAIDSVKLEENKLCIRGPECIEIDYAYQDCDYQPHPNDEQFIDMMIQKNIKVGEGWAGLSSDSLFSKYSDLPYTKWSPKFIDDDADSLKLRIVEIDWDNIGITTLPEAISNLRELTYLDLAGNNLTSLPTGIQDLSNLVELIVYENSLAYFPAGISNLSKLEVLEAYNNLLIELPITIGNLTSLLELRLQNNLLGVLPSELCDIIPQLTSFNVACNQLISDDEIGKCPGLVGTLGYQSDHDSCND